MIQHLVIGSRKSPLALVQAELAKAKLEEKLPECFIEIKTFQTTGDNFLADRLQEVGGKGVFVKELEEALFKQEIDLAIHSMKDMPARLADGLSVLPFLKREAPEDALLTNGEVTTIEGLKEGAVVGSASLRRKALLLRVRPDLKIQVLRGNVNTRLSKLASGEFDAIILAKAGLVRLGLEDKITETLSVDEFIPAANQGILGAEFLSKRADIQQVLEQLIDAETQVAFNAETAFLQTLNGGCQTPMGCYTKPLGNGQYHLQGFVSGEWAKPFYYQSLVFSQADSKNVGTQLAQNLLNLGADKVLSELVG